MIKGEASETYTIKQIGGFDRKSNTRLFIHGVPQFTDGNKYVVFLPEKSTLGFSSPLGLHQGSFSVISQDGEQIVTNGKNLNAPAATSQNSIQVPLAVRAENEAQTRLDDFLNSVRAYNTH